MGFWDGSGISWTICKQSASCSRQITTPTPHRSIFTGQMLFPTANKQSHTMTMRNQCAVNLHVSNTKMTKPSLLFPRLLRRRRAFHLHVPASRDTCPQASCPHRRRPASPPAGPVLPQSHRGARARPALPPSTPCLTPAARPSSPVQRTICVILYI